MMQSLRNILFVNLLSFCDATRGNVTSIWNNNDVAYQYEKLGNSTSLLDCIKMLKNIWEIVTADPFILVGLVILIAILIISLRWLPNWLREPIVICILGTLRNFWQRYGNLLGFQKRLENQETHNEPNVLYNSRQGIPFNV